MLTPRQFEVAQKVADGLSYKRIAQDLGISVPMVQEHVVAAAARLPGRGTPQFKVLFFVLKSPAP